MKIKSYTFHYRDKEGNRQKRKYKVGHEYDGILIRHDLDAKKHFYREWSTEQVIYFTADY